MINWGNIIDGFDGFEKMAVDYINDIEGRDGKVDWRRTKRTRDGNKDAIAIFVGYRPAAFGEVDWWMEAKYSKKLKRMTRYRLDATIVSAFIQQNVGRIAFVSNIEVKPRVISDIQSALTQSALCSEAVFYSKQHLEHWLLEDYGRYSKYFADLDARTFANLERPDIVPLSSELEVFPAYGTFKEPVDTLYQNECYTVELSIASKVEAEVPFRLMTKELSFSSPGKRARKTLKRPLKPGVNIVSLPLSLRLGQEGADNSLIIELNGRQLHSAKQLRFQREESMQLEAQVAIIETCRQMWAEAKKRASFTAIAVSGKSGTGKTYVARMIRNHVFDRTAILHELSFADDEMQNIVKMRNLVLSFLYPYIHPDDIDPDFLNELDVPSKSKDAIANLVAISLETSREDAGAVFEVASLETIILPTEQSNLRALILDNVQKASIQLQEALCNLLIIFKERGYSAICILAGQGSDRWAGIEALRQNVKLREYKCSITHRDITRQFTDLPAYARGDATELLFGSVIELTMFIRFVRDTGVSAGRLDDFRVAYHLFKDSELLDEYVGKQFLDLLGERSNAPAHSWDLLTFVYYCPELHGPDYYEDYSEALNYLFEKGLVKRNANDEIEPFHDIFAEIFRDKYRFALKEDFKLQNTSEFAKVMIEMAKENMGSAMVMSLLDSLFAQMRYKSLFQLLDPYFCDDDRRASIRNAQGDALYFKLCWLHAYANANSGQRVSGLRRFEDLKDEIGVPRQLETTAIRFLASFEAFNSSYEHMEYEKAESHWKDLETDLRRLKDCGAQDYDYKELIAHRQHEMQSIRLMLDAEQGKDVWDGVLAYRDDLKRAGRLEECVFDAFRLALTQLTSHGNEALRCIEECNRACKSGDAGNVKESLLIGFADEYFKCANDSSRSLEALHEAREGIKGHYYNDYNRHLPAMAVLYLLRSDWAAAQNALLEYYSTERKRSKRQDAICKVAQAAVFQGGAGEGGSVDVVDALGFAAQVFAPCPNYLPVIQHDIAQCTTAGSPLQVELFFGQEMLDGRFYFDARFIY